MTKIWLNGKLVAEDQAQVSILSHALHYGTAAFEGIRFYDTDRGPAIFRLSDHVRRLIYSTDALGMDVPYTAEEIERAIVETVQASTLPAGYIRPIIFYGTGGLGISPRNSSVEVAMIVLPWGKYLQKDAVALKTATIRRFHNSAFDPDAKIAGHYVNSVRAHEEAVADGFDEALLLSQEGYVAEGSGENIFIAKEGVLATPPQGNILPGITRSTIMHLLEEEGNEVVEKELSLQECKEADECFLVGTAAEVTPVARIDDQVIGAGKPGELTLRIAQKYHDIVSGTLPQYHSYLTFVEGA